MSRRASRCWTTRTQSRADRPRCASSVLLEAAAQPDSALGRALATAITVAADQTFAEVIGEAIAQARRARRRGSTRAGGVDAAIAELSRALGVAPDETIESDRRSEFFDGSLIAADANGRQSIARRWSRARRATRSRPSASTRCARSTATERIEAYLSIFCTGRARAAQEHRHQGASASSIPTLCQRLLAEQERVCALLARRRAVETPRAHRRAAHHRARGDRALSRREEPARPARLRRPDRQDARSCSPTPRAAWVHYKLDLGIDHVLIDEAQDTSPKQWEIVAAADRPNSSPARARASVDAHDLRGRRREAVDLLVPGRGAAASSTRCGSDFAARIRARRAATSRDVKFQLLVPLRRRTCCGAVDAVFEPRAGLRAD